jgi:rubrerythrin
MDEDRSKLIRNFEELRGFELQAYNLYKSLLPLIADKQDQATVRGIMQDEAHHAELVQEIIDILEA